MYVTTMQSRNTIQREEARTSSHERMSKGCIICEKEHMKLKMDLKHSKEGQIWTKGIHDEASLRASF